MMFEPKIHFLKRKQYRSKADAVHKVNIEGGNCTQHQFFPSCYQPWVFRRGNPIAYSRIQNTYFEQKIAAYFTRIAH